MIVVFVLLCLAPFRLSLRFSPSVAAVCPQCLSVLPDVYVLRSCLEMCLSLIPLSPGSLVPFTHIHFHSDFINTGLNVSVTNLFMRERGRSPVSGTCLNLYSCLSVVCISLSLQSTWVTTLRQCWTETWQRTYPESCTQMTM